MKTLSEAVNEINKRLDTQSQYFFGGLKHIIVKEPQGYGCFYARPTDHHPYPSNTIAVFATIR